MSILTSTANILPTLGHAMLREDSGFHSFQIVDAGFKQYRERRGTEAGRHVIVAMTRFLAAHAPTARAVDQTYNIAVRLNRGDQAIPAHESNATVAVPGEPVAPKTSPLSPREWLGSPAPGQRR